MNIRPLPEHVFWNVIHQQESVLKLYDIDIDDYNFNEEFYLNPDHLHYWIVNYIYYRFHIKEKILF